MYGGEIYEFTLYVLYVGGSGWPKIQIAEKFPPGCLIAIFLARANGCISSCCLHLFLLPETTVLFYHHCLYHKVSVDYNMRRSTFIV